MAGLLFGLGLNKRDNPFVVLIPFLAGLLFGLLAGGGLRPAHPVLIPFLAGLLFGRLTVGDPASMRVLIPFLAGLLFGQDRLWQRPASPRLNPLFGGSAFRTEERIAQRLGE